MTERRRYLVLDGFVPRLPEHDWIQVAHVYEGMRASDILVSAPMIRLIHPTEPDRTERGAVEGRLSGSPHVAVTSFDHAPLSDPATARY